MKRTTLVEYEDASPAVQAIYDEIMNTMGTPSVLNFLKALGNNEHVLRATWTMLKETVIEGEIPALLKQLILFKVSISVGNEYCTALHGHAALNLHPTLTYDDLCALSGGQCSATLPTLVPRRDRCRHSRLGRYQERRGRGLGFRGATPRGGLLGGRDR